MMTVTLRQSITEQLTLHGEFTISQAGTASAALDFVTQHCYHAIFLDVGLPDMDGLDIIRHVREKGEVLPIIIVSSRENETEKVAALARRLLPTRPCRHSIQWPGCSFSIPSTSVHGPGT